MGLAAGFSSPEAGLRPGREQRPTELHGDLAVRVAGARADGASDNTAAIQHSLDAAARTGGRVQLSPGRYLVKGSLRLPPNITLEG